MIGLNILGNLIFRILVSVSVFYYLKLKHFESLPILIILLFVFDTLDCALAIFRVNCKSIEYQKIDKMCDLFIYFIFIIMFNNLFDEQTLKLLILFMLYRLIGVVKFVETGKSIYLNIYADFINSTLIAYAVYKAFNLSNRCYYVLIIFGMIIKLISEHIMHNRNY